MDLNFFIFPKPKPTYSYESMYGRLIHIPHDCKQWALTEPYVTSKFIESIYDHQSELKIHGSYKGKCLPCFYIPCAIPSTKILLYFHGNAEDVYLTEDLMSFIQENLNVHIIVMEYEGYGVYEGMSSAESIIRDADILFNYVTNVIKYPPSDIILFGRSIGSGPASYIASKYRVHSLILMSAFTSLRAVAKGFVGSILQYAISERFNNIELIKKVRCPVFIIHGKKDEIVDCAQAMELRDTLEEVKIDTALYMPIDMDHNSFDFDTDFIKPLVKFYEERGFKTDPENGNKGIITLPIKAFNTPVK